MTPKDEILELAVSAGFYKNKEGTITSPFIEDVDISELLVDFAHMVIEREREKFKRQQRLFVTKGNA